MECEEREREKNGSFKCVKVGGRKNGSLRKKIIFYLLGRVVGEGGSRERVVKGVVGRCKGGRGAWEPMVGGITSLESEMS